MTDHGNKALKFAAGLGCLVSIAGPFLAILLYPVYPRARWLFALVIVGIAIVILNALSTKGDPTPSALADEIERLLNGTFGGFDVDTFEHRRIRNPTLREFRHRSMAIGGLPETWVRLGEDKKNQIRSIIRELRELAQDLEK